MSKKHRLPGPLAEWAEARSRYRLSDAVVQMARELGLNPKKLGGKANHAQEPWKAPLQTFIEDLYEKRFDRRAPANVLSLEALAKAQRTKREATKLEKANRREAPLAAREIAADRRSGFSLNAVVDRRGEVLDIQEGDMERRLSDALLELMKPYIPYPPALDDLHLFEAALRWGAEIWNATLIEDEAERVSVLSEIGRKRARAPGSPEREGVRFVQELAARKVALYPDDKRPVVKVGVEPRGKEVLITAASASWQKSLPSRSP